MGTGKPGTRAGLLGIDKKILAKLKATLFSEEELVPVLVERDRSTDQRCDTIWHINQIRTIYEGVWG